MKKFDRGYIRYSFISSLFTSLLIVVAIYGYLFDDLEIEAGFAALVPYLAGLYVLIYIAQVVYAALYVRTSGYMLTEKDVQCRRGVLFRKSSVLTYDKIHAVNKKQGLIQKLFGIAVLTVDSGSTTNAFSAEITVIEKAHVVDALMREIECRQAGEDVPSQPVDSAVTPADNLYHFSSKLQWVYAGLSVAGAAIGLLILGAFALIGVGVFLFVMRGSANLSGVEWLLAVLIGTVALTVVVSIFSLIGGVLSSFVAYHRFCVTHNRDTVEIRYGLFVQQTNRFQYDRIKALKIDQGPIKRLFGFVSAGLEVVGYGVDNNQNGNNQNNVAAPGMLLPLCEAKNVNQVVGNILPDYVPAPITHRAASFGAFICWPLLITAIVCGAVMLSALIVLLLLSVNILWAVAIAVAAWLCVAVWLLISAALQYRHAGMTVGDTMLTLQNGALVRRTTVIHRKDIVGVEYITTLLRQKHNVYTCKIHFFSNAASNTVVVKNISGDVRAALDAFIKD